MWANFYSPESAGSAKMSSDPGIAMSVWLVSRIVPADCWIEEKLPERMKMVVIIELRKARICCRGNGR